MTGSLLYAKPRQVAMIGLRTAAAQLDTAVKLPSMRSSTGSD
jgi:hypothetical protein